MKAIIIGGGIGGLASAVALARRARQVEVLERAPEFTEVGAGLSIWANGLRALHALGVGESVRRHATLEGQAGIQDSRGRWLARTKWGRIGAPVWADGHGPPRRPVGRALCRRARRGAAQRRHGN